MLAKVIRENQRDWPDLVPYVVFCYKATEHSATGYCPFFIFTERQPLWNVDLLLPETQAEESTLPDYAAKVTERLAVASRVFRENLKKQQRPLASGIIENQDHEPFPRGI